MPLGMTTGTYSVVVGDDTATVITFSLPYVISGATYPRGITLHNYPPTFTITYEHFDIFAI